MTQLITIKANNASATFAPQMGATGTSIIMPDSNNSNGIRELLYFPKDFNINNYQYICGGWPFLFPICARISRDGKEGHYLYNGKTYCLDIHGFASTMAWNVTDVKTDELTMELRANTQTFKQYPFDFTVRLNYKIADNKLTCIQTYINNGDNPMPYYAGFHPYFLIDPKRFTKNEVMLDFKPTRRLQYNNDLTDIIGEQPTFTTPVKASDAHINEQLSQLGADKTCHMIFPDNFTINMKAYSKTDPDMFSYLQLYNIPDEPFYCLEPWMSHPNALNTTNASRILQPWQCEEGVLILETHAPHQTKK